MIEHLPPHLLARMSVPEIIKAQNVFGEVPEKTPDVDAPTDKQIDRLIDLGCTETPKSRKHAGYLIGKLKREQA